MSKVQLAISPLTWSNDDMPSLGGEIPLESCLAGMQAAGFQGSEMGVKYPRTTDELKPKLEEYGLVLASGWYSLELCKRSVEEEIEAVQSHLELMRGCGCKAMVAGEVSNTVHGNIEKPLSQRVVLTEEQWKEYGEKLTRFADYLKEQGIKLAFHHHVGTVCESPRDLEMFIKHTGPSVGLTFDTAHVTYGGGDAAEMIRLVGDRIVHFHTKDVRFDVMRDAREKDLPFLKAVLNGVFTVPGDGGLDWDEIFAELKKFDYEGWLVVEAEQDPAVAHPQTYANMAHKNLITYVEKAGL
ncbi:myo-inosose-2 dehydratase [Endozoicomonas sp. Mp262]|uniref:myo-inosose-2 dehydratase n=1 Tax=Endozoicomonas sp. Mp262 TaxID=2919499 RepID=UPI0021DAF853